MTLAPARAWWAVAVLLALYVLSFVDRQVIYLLGEEIKRDFGIGDFLLGLLMGPSFAVFYTLFGVPIARLADSRSRRVLIAAGLVVWSAMTAACGLSRSYVQLLLARMGVGVGEATLSPASYSLIADAFPKERLSTALGVYSIATYLGPGLASAIGGLVLGVIGTRESIAIPIAGESRPWQVVFLAVGIPGLLLLPLLLTVREPRRLEAARGASIAETLRHLWSRRRAYLCHNLGFAFLSFSGYGTAVWSPAFLQRNHGMSAAEAGLALGWILAAAGSAGVVFGGWLADRLAKSGHADAPMRSGLIAAIAWIPAGVLYPVVDDRGLAFALMAPAVFTSAMPWGAAAAAVQEMTPPSMRAQASAVYLFVINAVGLGLGPSAIGFATEFLYGDDQAVRWSMTWVTLGAHFVSAALLWAGLGPCAAAVSERRVRNGPRF